MQYFCVAQTGPINNLKVDLVDLKGDLNSKSMMYLEICSDKTL